MEEKSSGVIPGVIPEGIAALIKKQVVENVTLTEEERAKVAEWYADQQLEMEKARNAMGHYAEDTRVPKESKT